MSDQPKKIGVMIGTPVRHFSGIHPFTRMTEEQLKRIEDSPYAFSVCVMEGGLIRARNKIVDAFLRTNHTWLLWWDDDIVPDDPVDAILRILGHKQPIVGALYTIRTNTNPHWVATFLHEVEIQKQSLLQVMELGTGFKLYHRQVFENLARLYPNIAYTDRDSGEKFFGFFQQCVLVTDVRPDGDLLSEDYFCDHLCRHVKIPIFADTSLKLKHQGGNQELYPAAWPPIPGVD